MAYAVFLFYPRRLSAFPFSLFKKKKTPHIFFLES
jgi:hypothetical protein